MEVGHPWQQRSGSLLGILCGGSYIQAPDPAGFVHLKEYIFGPSIGKKGRRGKKSCYP